MYFTITLQPGVYRVLATSTSGITYAKSVFVGSIHAFGREVMERAKFYDSLDDLLI
jgi:hypothetical protein